MDPEAEKKRNTHKKQLRRIWGYLNVVYILSSQSEILRYVDGLMVTRDNVFVLTEYMLMYLGAKCYNVSNIISKFQVKIHTFS